MFLLILYIQRRKRMKKRKEAWQLYVIEKKKKKIEKFQDREMENKTRVKQ